MNSLTKVIESAIKNAIEEYVQCISQKYDDVDVDELENIWNDVSKTMKISVSFKKSTDGNSTTSSPKKGDDNSDCPYLYIKGDKKGQPCGAKAKEGNIYCSRHKKHEGTIPKERTALPETKKSSIRPNKSKSRSPAKSVQRVLRKHKEIGKLWHPESTLVFRSAKDRIVIGKCVENKLVPLVKSDYDECRKWCFAFEQPEESDDDDLKEEPEKDSEEEEEETGEKVSIYLTVDSSSGSREKFWECTVEGCNYSTRHGKIGKDGTTKNKEFDTYDLALAEMKKSVKSKKKKGYVERKSKDVKTRSRSPVPSSEEVSVNQTTKKKHSRRSKSSMSSDSGNENVSDIERTINELQNSPRKDEKEEEDEIEEIEDEDEEIEDEDEKLIGKDFIPRALGLKGRAMRVPIGDKEEEDEDEEEDDEDDFMLGDDGDESE